MAERVIHDGGDDDVPKVLGRDGSSALVGLVDEADVDHQILAARGDDQLFVGQGLLHHPAKYSTMGG